MVLGQELEGLGLEQPDRLEQARQCDRPLDFVERVDLSAVMEIERYSHVMHISSTVEGDLRPELSCWDALRASLAVGGFSVLVAMTTVAGTAAVLFVGVRHVQSDALTLGSLLVVMAFLTQLVSSF